MIQYQVFSYQGGVSPAGQWESVQSSTCGDKTPLSRPPPPAKRQPQDIFLSFAKVSNIDIWRQSYHIQSFFTKLLCKKSHFKSCTAHHPIYCIGPINMQHKVWQRNYCETLTSREKWQMQETLFPYLNLQMIWMQSPYLIFVAGTTGGARVKKICPV